MAYIGLHNHDERSNFRGRDALTKTEELIEYCMELGHKGVAITNHETISSCLKANKYWTKLRKEGNTEFKIINGNEIYLCKNVNEGERPNVFPHFILLAKNRRGYEQLCELSTRAWVNNSFMSTMMRVPTYYSDLYEVIGDDKGNLVGCSSCQGGTLARTLLLYKDTGEEKYWKSAIAWINRMNNLFGKENFFLEMQPSDDENQVYINDKITVLSSITGNNFVVTCDSHYLKAEDRRSHEIFLKAQNIEREVDSFYATTYVMSEEEIHTYMDKYLGYDVVQKAIDNTMLVYDMCEYYDLTKPLHIPYLPLNTQEPKKTSEFYEKVPLLKELSESEYDSDRHLVRELVKAMEKDKYLQTEEAYENISICLQTLIDSSNKMNVRWSAYLLQIADYVDIAWNKAGVIVGAGRGSGVGFILNYMLNIIQVNPLRETTRTYFWRFLNPERASVLDIDLDVPSSKREVVIKALKSVYGEDRVTQVLALNTEGSRSAILTAARGIGFNDDEAQYLSSLVLSDRGMQRSLKTMYYGNDEFKPDTQFRNEMDKYPELWEAAQKIEGVINGTSSHAGGVIIVDEPFTNTTGLMRTNSGTIITQNDLHECEDMSLIKIDLLATEALDKMQTCLELLLKDGLIEDKGNLKDTYEAAIGVYNIEKDDPKMWKMLHEHKVQSFFQMEKESGIHALEIAKPMSVDDLATINSVMRLMAQEEGAEQPLDKYARFKNDITEWYKEMDEWGVKKEDQEVLKEILGTSCGICEAQEYLFLLTMHPKIGGFSLGWADRLRKSVSKKLPKDFKQLEKEYYENAKEKGLDKNLVDYVWKVLVATQRGYGLCQCKY